MKQKSLSQRLVAFLKKEGGWVAKARIQDVVREYTTYTAENAGRRLRELQEDGELEVKYERGHAFYRFKVHQTTLAI